MAAVQLVTRSPGLLLDTPDSQVTMVKYVSFQPSIYAQVVVLRRPVDWHLGDAAPDMVLVGSDGSVPASRAILATASSWLSRSEKLVQNRGLVTNSLPQAAQLA